MKEPWWRTPGSLALIGPGLLIGRLLGVTTLRSTAGGPERRRTHQMQTGVCSQDRMMHSPLCKYGKTFSFRGHFISAALK